MRHPARYLILLVVLFFTFFPGFSADRFESVSDSSGSKSLPPQLSAGLLDLAVESSSLAVNSAGSLPAEPAETEFRKNLKSRTWSKGKPLPNSHLDANAAKKGKRRKKRKQKKAEGGCLVEGLVLGVALGTFGDWMDWW